MPDRPALFYLDAIRNLRGEPSVTSPHGHPHSLKIERVFTKPRGWTAPAYGDADPNAGYAAAGARLTDIHVTGGDNINVEYYTCYEALGSRAEQDLWNEQPKTYPYGDVNFPRITRKYRFFKDSIPALVIGATADTIFSASNLFNLQEEGESSVVVVLTAFFDDIPTVAQQEIGEDGNEGLGLSIAYPYGASAYPVLTYRARVLNSAYVPATDSQGCPIPGYTTLQLTSQGKEPAQDAPTVSVMTLEYQRVPGLVLTASIDAAKLPRQLTPIPAYYLNNDLLTTTKQVVAYGTQADTPSTTILSSKVEADGTLKAIKTNVVRANPTLPIVYLPRMAENYGGAQAQEYRQIVAVTTPGTLNAAIDSAVTLISVVAPWFNRIDQRTNPLSPLEAELVYTIIPDFATLYGIENKSNIPDKFLQGFNLETVEDWMNTTGTVPSDDYIDPADLYPASTAISIKIVPETIYRAKRTTISLPAGSVLPTLTATRRNEHGQVETLVESITDGSQTLPTITALITAASQDPIGGGLFLRSITTIPSVYAGDEYTVEIPNAIPEEFRALALTTSHALTAAGTATMPTLGTGEYRKSVRQVDAQTIRTETTALNTAALPLTVTDSELVDGNAVSITKTLKAGTQSFTASALTLDGSGVRDLGNGLTLMTVRALPSYPTLQGQTIDNKFGLPLPFTSQEMSPAAAAAYAGQSNKEIIPKTQLLSQVRDVSLTTAGATILDAYCKPMPGVVARVNGIPDVLLSVGVEWNTSNGKADSSETASASASGSSGHIEANLRNSAQASASIIPSVVPVILTPEVNNRPVMDYYFFVPDGSSVAAVLSKLSTIIGGTVNPWPLFQTVSHTIVCKGEKVSVRASASTGLSVSFGENGNALSRSQGNSADQDTTSISQTTTIKPTIHGDILVGASSNGGNGDLQLPPGVGVIGPVGGVIVTNTTQQATLSANAASAIPAWGLSASRSVSLTAKASVSPSKLAATPGLTAIPSTGLYAMDINSDPFKEGRTLVRVRVFDFASLTSANAGVGVGTNITPDAVTANVLTNTPVLVGTNASSPTATFTDITPPSILVDLADQSVRTGSKVTLSVSASGAAPLAYQWSKDGTVIPGVTGSSYVIAAVALSNAGSYTVAISNSFGSTASRAATLTVNTPVSITTQPAAATANVGDSVTFSVTAAGTNLVYEWRQNNIPIPGATGTSYTIPSVATTNAGNYKVRVSNVLGAIFSSIATLSVNVASAAPTIQTQPSGGAYNVGDSLSLAVAVTGTTPFTYQWRMNGTPISGATASTFNIASLHTTDAGTYSVTITNSVGSVTSSGAAITVAQVPPVINSITPIQRIKVNQTITLTVNATGDGLTYQWYRSYGLEVGPPETSDSTYAISGATSASFSMSPSVISAEIEATPAYSNMPLGPLNYINKKFVVVVSNSAGSVVGQAQVLVVPTNAPATPTMRISSPLYNNYSGTPESVVLGLGLDTPWTEDLVFTLTNNANNSGPFTDNNGNPIYPAQITIPAGSLGTLDTYVNGSGSNMSPGGVDGVHTLFYTMSAEDFTTGYTGNPSKQEGTLEFTAKGKITKNGGTLATQTATDDVPVPYFVPS